MKAPLLLSAVLATVLLAGAASAAKKTYTAKLSGDAEIPAVDMPGSGTAVLTVDDVAMTICGSVTYADLSGPPSAMHIHEGDDTVASGGVVQTLPTGPSPVKINLEVDSAAITTILTSPTYVNVHTAMHAGGEIRGQLAEEGEEQPCAETSPDGGTDAAAADGYGTDEGAAPPDGGATTTRADAGAPGVAPAAVEDDGCSTTGARPGGGLLLAFSIGLVLSAVVRGRKRR